MESMTSYEMIQIEGVIFSSTPQAGALIVFCPKKFKGRNAYVALNREIRGNRVVVQIMERRVNGIKRYVAVFPSLPTGTHRVSIPGTNGVARSFSVFPDSISEVDLT